MAKKKAGETTPPDSMQIIARLLGLIAVRGVEKDQAALQLSGAGLEDKVITELLGVNDSYVRLARFKKKKK